LIVILYTISKKFVDIFEWGFDIGKSCVLICINNDELANKSRLFDSSINAGSRIEDISLKNKTII
jgi:hypothetical protein